jgi:hypothetical protein
LDVFTPENPPESAKRLPRLIGVEPFGVVEPADGRSATTSGAPPIGVDPLDVFEPAFMRLGVVESDG